jgi:DNA-binding response OmpR family regulator
MNEHQNPPALERASLPSLSPTHRILVVEDDADIRHLNREVLTRHGYHVDAAEDGARAWEALTTQTYDLMITDNSMPRVTGIELLRKIRDASLPLPVIMATGVLPEWEFAQNPELAPAATLLKPYTVPELLRAVRAVLYSADNPDATARQSRYGPGQPLPNHLPL